MRTNKFSSVLFGMTVNWYKRSQRLLLSTNFDHTNLLTKVHQSCEDSLMLCVLASPSAAINGVRRLSIYSTVEICWQYSTIHPSSQSEILVVVVVRKACTRRPITESLVRRHLGCPYANKNGWKSRFLPQLGGPVPSDNAITFGTEKQSGEKSLRICLLVLTL